MYELKHFFRCSFDNRNFVLIKLFFNNPTDFTNLWNQKENTEIRAKI